jgi:serine/threonine-protein kinase SRPK3
MMNGGDIKAAINKAKQVANAANNAANGNEAERRKGQDLKPIITTEGSQSVDASPNTSVNEQPLVSKDPIQASTRSLLGIIAYER